MNIGNQKLQKKINRERIITLLREQGELSRSQIAEQTGLGWGSVTKYTAELLSEEVICEMRTERSGGRNSVILGLNRDYKYMIGIDLGAGFIKGILTDMSGLVCESHSEATKWDAAQSEMLEQIYSVVGQLLDMANIPKERLLAIGCGVAGVIDYGQGVVLQAGNFRDFNHVPLAGFLRERFSVPCFVANTMMIRMLGAIAAGLIDDNHNAAYIWLGTGVGSGIVCQGKILIPTKYEILGDIAHYMVERNGPQCYCGLHGCLETMVGSRYLIQHFQGVIPGKTDPEWADVMDSAKNGNSTVKAILARAGRYVADAIGGIIQFHHPERVILDGGMTGFGDALVQPLRDALEERFPRERFDVNNIIIADRDYYRGALGAASFAWDKLYYSSEHKYVNLDMDAE